MRPVQWERGRSPMDLYRHLHATGRDIPAPVRTAACLECFARETEADATAIAGRASGELLDRLAAAVGEYRRRALDCLQGAPA